MAVLANDRIHAGHRAELGHLLQRHQPVLAHAHRQRADDLDPLAQLAGQADDDVMPTIALIDQAHGLSGQRGGEGPVYVGGVEVVAPQGVAVEDDLQNGRAALRLKLDLARPRHLIQDRLGLRRPASPSRRNHGR